MWSHKALMRPEIGGAEGLRLRTQLPGDFHHRRRDQWAPGIQPQRRGDDLCALGHADVTEEQAGHVLRSGPPRPRPREDKDCRCRG